MTMNQEMVDIMGGLKTQWGILKDDTKDKGARLGACARICNLSEQAKILDPKFEMIDMNNTRYAEFLPEKYKAKLDVIWGNPVEMNEMELRAIETLRRLESIAVGDIKIKLPTELVTSQKFGMIVSAYTEKLVHIYCSQNS